MSKVGGPKTTINAYIHFNYLNLYESEEMHLNF